MSDEQKANLQRQLWNIANELRGKMNADEFRDYILGFIFYKYLSEKISNYIDKDLLANDNLTYDQLKDRSDRDKYLSAVRKATIDKLGYFLEPEELFLSVAKNSDINDNLNEDLNRILQNIEKSTMGEKSEGDFEKLFSELDLESSKLGKTVSERNKLIAKVLKHLDKIDFQLEDSKIDILGDAYEYLISKFAAGAGKKAGEFYTPQEVSEILARIVTLGKETIRDVYDPTCGSGSLLLRVKKHVKEVHKIYGQEMNNTTYNLARMNMILHDVHYADFDLKQEDTLEKPQHLDQRFEAVVANPPFSAKWSADPIHLAEERFAPYGVLAPKSKADYAFITHMIHHLDDNGTLAVVAPHGVLFRGAAEGKIRQFLVEQKNYLDAVIGLPANLFFGTSIPACILVFKKCRQRDDSVLFIEASREFEKDKNQNRLTSENINKIIDTYAKRAEIERYSHNAKLDEIAENDYNLNIPRYVDTFEPEPEIDLDEVTAGIKQIDKQITKVDAKIAKYCDELGIEGPF
ncbi:type I restriction-modification system subunit M [Candidatus Saccharibacteria bacterium]|nr:MAG: type I restriction-modification system subunit M [Candidatus Saccharibacteria bacterium]